MTNSEWATHYRNQRLQMHIVDTIRTLNEVERNTSDFGENEEREIVIEDMRVLVTKKAEDDWTIKVRYNGNNQDVKNRRDY